MSGEDISNAVIIELFAGTARATACLRQVGLRSSFGVDHVKVKPVRPSFSRRLDDSPSASCMMNQSLCEATGSHKVFQV